MAIFGALLCRIPWILSSCYVAVLCLSVAILSPVLAATLVGGASVAVPTNCVDGYKVHSRFLTPQLVHLASFSSFVCLLCSQLRCVSHSLAFVVAVEFHVWAHCGQRGAGSPSADWNGAAASLTVWSHVTNMLSTCSSIAFFVYIWILTPSICNTLYSRVARLVDVAVVCAQHRSQFECVLVRSVPYMISLNFNKPSCGNHIGAVIVCLRRVLTVLYLRAVVC